MKTNPKVIMVPKVWSPSALESYDDCPRRFQLERVQKLCKKCFAGRLYRPRGPVGQDPGNTPQVCGNCGTPEKTPTPIAEGNVTHAHAEQFIRGHVKRAGPGLLHPKVKKLLVSLRAGYVAQRVRVEMELAFTRAWKLTEWFAKDTWVRFKVDVARLVSPVVELYDWKTGKQKPEQDARQMRGYGTAALLAGLGEETRASLVFTKTGEIVSPPEGALRREQLPKLLREWERRASPLFIDKTFQPKPSYQCRYCPYSMNVGGPCPH